MPDEAQPHVFVSHTEADKPIADALSEAIDRLFKGKVTVSYSTKRGGDGAVRAGENWFTWIGTQVSNSRVTVVLLTPRSVSKPWLLWETGAVYGAALMQGGESARTVRPLLYRLDADDMPSPLRASNVQSLRGDRSEDIEEFLSQLITDIDVLTADQKVAAGRSLADVVTDYLGKVDAAFASEELPALDQDDFRERPILHRALSLTITALQALYPTAKINGRYFFASNEGGRDFLVRSDDIYHESVWMQEFALHRIDVELDGDALIIGQSFKAKAAIYKVLTEEDAAKYRPELRAQIDPDQQWVLACPVLMKSGRPVGVLCLYGKKPPARKDSDVARLKQVVELLSEVYEQAYAIMGL
jgi:hypothetical protein